MNPPSVIVLAVILALVGLSLVRLFRHRNNGCSHCSGGCVDCPHSKNK